jgi:ABC-type nickel/cobalt efflux system permease component RcnA
LYAVLLLGSEPPVAEAHSVGAGLLAHDLRISLDPGKVRVDYTVEIPASVLIRQYRKLLQATESPSIQHIEAHIASRQIERLHKGMLWIWNGEEMAVRLTEGRQERSGFGNYNFFQYRLLLEGSFPAGQEGKLLLVNRNYDAFEAVYFASLSVSPGYEIIRTDLENPKQRFLIDSDSGRPWSLWRGLRDLRIEIRPAPFWRSLVGQGERTEVDLEDVYQRLVPGGASPDGAVDIAEARRAEPSTGRLKALLTKQEMDLPMVMAALSIAFFLGAAHALSPGHGKALVGAYLVATRGRPIDALVLGLLVTFSHVSSVILLGVASLLASRYFVPEQVFPYLEMASAAIILGLGIWMLKTRWAHAKAHMHAASHSHAFPTQEKAGPPGGARWREMLSLGVSGGIVPCPSALAILLVALALQKLALGIGMIVVFSLGLALVLVGVGLVLVWTRSFLKPLGQDRPWLAWLPVASSLVIILIGVLMLGRILWAEGLLFGLHPTHPGG